MYYIVKNRGTYDIVEECELEDLAHGWIVFKGPFKSFEEALEKCPSQLVLV